MHVLSNVWSVFHIRKAGPGLRKLVQSAIRSKLDNMVSLDHVQRGHCCCCCRDLDEDVCLAAAGLGDGAECQRP